MVWKTGIIGFSILFQILFSGTNIIAQDSIAGSYFVKSGSKLWLEGKSNINRFIFKTEEIQGAGLLDSIPRTFASSTLDTSDYSVKVQVSIPVKSLNSNNRKMNQDMYEALKADSFNAIHYELIGAELVASPGSEGEYFIVKTTGALRIAGGSKTIEMVIQIRQLAEGRFQIKGKKELFMTDFSINPPTALKGLIKTNNKIMIHFDFIASIGEENNVYRRQ